MTISIIPEVRYPRRKPMLSVPESFLYQVRERLLRCLRHLDAAETGTVRLWSPELQALCLRLMYVERLIAHAEGFPIVQQLRLDRERLRKAYRAELLRLLAQGDGDLVKVGVLAE